MIQRKFEDFQRSVMAKAERFSEVDNFAKRLVAEGHTDTVIIKEQQDILRWVTLLFSCSLVTSQNTLRETASCVTRLNKTF